MSETPKLILLRHGQTGDNVLNILSGRNDIALTGKGVEQAVAAGALLKSYRIDKVFSSPLQRAFNTAALALKGAGMQDIIIERRNEIIEADSGEFTGCAFAFDKVGKCQIGGGPSGRPFADWDCIHDTRMPGGESDQDVVTRVRNFFASHVLPRLQEGESVMVVAHVAILRAFDIVLGTEPAPEPGQRTPFKLVPNAMPIVFEYKDNGLSPV